MASIRALWRKPLRKKILISWVLAMLLMLASACLGFEMQSASGGEIAAVNFIPAREIFINNLSMLGMNLLGILLLGIPNLISGVMNGYAMGSFASIAGKQFGIGWALKAILPHGWLELPVILLAISFGAVPWIYIISRLRCPNQNRKTLLKQLVKYLCIASLICVAALLLAAIIEASVSMQIC